MTGEKLKTILKEAESALIDFSVAAKAAMHGGCDMLDAMAMAKPSSADAMADIVQRTTVGIRKATAALAAMRDETMPLILAEISQARSAEGGAQ